MLGRNQIVLNQNNAKELGISVEGVHSVFPSRKISSSRDNHVWCEEEEVSIDETQWEKEKVNILLQSVESALDMNAKLPTSSFCNLINSEFQVVLRDSNPVYTQQYPIPQDIQPAVCQRIKEWVDNGWVKKWDKNSKNVWNSPLLAVLKQSGGVNEADDIRLCIDLWKVNSKSKEPIYTLPTPVKMFRTVGGVKFFTEIDLSSAYHYIKVEEDS